MRQTRIYEKTNVHVDGIAGQSSLSVDNLNENESNRSISDAEMIV